MEALMIMIIGMTGVFIFLVVLIGIMQFITSRLPETATPIARAGQSAQGAATNDTQLIAVIQAAVHAYEADPARA